MSAIKEKSIPLAIGLNFLLPGIGYMYMGKVIIGIAALLLVLAIFATTSIDTLVIAWIGINIIMIIDMLILGKKRKKQIADNTMMKCPNCAELIKKEAKICRYCKSSLEKNN